MVPVATTTFATPANWTNWEAAMLQAAAEPAADRDLVVFITDGDPTAYLNNNGVPVT